MGINAILGASLSLEYPQAAQRPPAEDLIS